MTKTHAAHLSQHVDLVARHYDFLPFEEHCARSDSFPFQKSAHRKTPLAPPADQHYRDLVSGIDTLYARELNTKRGNHLFYTTTTDAGEVCVTFHAIDVVHAFADPLLIQVTRSLLHALGYEHRIRINMLGDKDAKKRFSRELIAFFKRSVNLLPEEPRVTTENDVLAAYRALIATDDDLSYHSPAPIDHLNEKSRRNLREILEYLDMSEASYEIDPRLVGDYTYHSGFMFTADILTKGGEVSTPPTCTVYGGSYDDYAHQNHDPRHTCASVTIRFKASVAVIPTQKRINTKSVVLAEIGFTPKLYGFGIMDTLLHAGMSVHHCTTSLSLTEQLQFAQERNAQIILIAGSHETTRKEIIIRNLARDTQKTIPLAKLVQTLRPLVN